MKLTNEVIDTIYAELRAVFQKMQHDGIGGRLQWCTARAAERGITYGKFMHNLRTK